MVPCKVVTEGFVEEESWVEASILGARGRQGPRLLIGLA